MSSTASIAPEPPANGFKVGGGVTADVGLSIWGDLGLGWFGKLSMALARRGMSIQDAQATRIAHDSWTGRLELLTGKANVDPYTLDYLALAREPAGGEDTGAEPRLSRTRIERSSAGTLELTFSADDQLGLLANLLDRLEFLGLFPERLRVTTQGERVDDTLWLRGVAGNAPSPQAEDALRALMARLTASTGGT
jgi:hypothetical protein